MFELCFKCLSVQLFFNLLFSTVVVQLVFIAAFFVFPYSCFLICFSGSDSALQLFFMVHCKWLSGLSIMVVFRLILNTVVFHFGFEFVFEKSCVSIVSHCCCFTFHYRCFSALCIYLNMDSGSLVYVLLKFQLNLNMDSGSLVKVWLKFQLNLKMDSGNLV